MTSISVSIPSSELEKAEISSGLSPDSPDLPTPLEHLEGYQIREEEKEGGLRAWLVVLGG